MDGSYFGFIEILDIVSWIVNLLGEDVFTRQDVELEKLEAFKSTKVINVMSKSGNFEVYFAANIYTKKKLYGSLPKGSSLLSAVEMMARGINRIAGITVHF